MCDAPEFHSPFLHRGWPPATRPSQAGLLWSALDRREGRVQLWQKAVIPRQRNQRKPLSKNIREKRELGQAFAMSHGEEGVPDWRQKEEKQQGQ